MSQIKTSRVPIECFYHGGCMDGVAAAAIILNKYPHAKCYAMNHGYEVRIPIKDKIIYVVDFSFEEAVLKNLKIKAKEVHWYDHHKTALPTQKSLGWGIVNLEESGASLTWKQEYPDQEEPKIIAYIRDKDLYTWRLPHSRAINMELRKTPGVLDPTHAIWKKFLNNFTDEDLEDLIFKGEVGLRNQRDDILTAVRNGFEIDFHGHKALAVNWSLEASAIGEYIYQEKNFPLAVVFYFNGENWTFSLRSNTVDVSDIAQGYGGGGHPGAAGFRQDNIDWLLKLKK